MRRMRRYLCLLPWLLPVPGLAAVDVGVTGVKGELKTALLNGTELSPGSPVLVEAVDIQLDRVAAELPAVKLASSAVAGLQGKRLDEGAYRSARDNLGNALTGEGYLDARLTVHRVEVTRGKRSAVIRLAWDAGTRYRYGAIRFEGSLWQPSLFARHVPFKSGDYFDQNQLLDLQRALNGADYFSTVDVATRLDGAAPATVDIDVRLAPAKRSIYSGGPILGTDIGFGARGSIEKRWVNSYGHRWKSEAVLAQRSDKLDSQYIIPLPDDDKSSLSIGAYYADEKNWLWATRDWKLGIEKSSPWHGWTRTIGVYNLASRFAFDYTVIGPEGDQTGHRYRERAAFTYAEASLERKQADDAEFVRRGWSLRLSARSTAGSLLSSARYSSLTAEARWIRALGERDRLILRGSLGHLWTSDFSLLPPELRFFAGGDRSIRGYAFESQGPRDIFDDVVGGQSLAVASATLEHYFTPQWGAAAFIDAGNAFDGLRLQPKVGVGLGIRWRSPIGMVRVDAGVPVHDRHEHGVRFHLVVGSDL
jgi:translocation and assembly module TamA